MSDQPGPGTGSPAPPSEGSDLEGYFRANRGTITESALRRAAIEAGHRADVVEAALSATRDGPLPGDPGVATRRVLIAYLAVWLILDVLMFVNPANQRSGEFLGDTRGIGILILSISLGAGFLASLAWIASRRAFLLLVGTILVLGGIASINAIVPAALAIGGGAVVILLVMRGRPATPTTSARAPSVELLMSMPLLILLVVGGICVATGLPIPRAV